MNADTKVKWLEALRSGEYKQATGKLKDNEHRVLTDIPAECDLDTVKFGASQTFEVDGKTVRVAKNTSDEAYAYFDAPGVGYCCLGVLVKMLHGDTAFTQNVSDDEESSDDEWYCHYDNGENMLADPEAFGLSEDTQNDLAQLNDGGKSFAFIADVIEWGL